MARKERKKKTYPISPICQRFPQMPDDLLADLVKDIEQNGQQEPCQLDAEGRILDGRNRQLAWHAAVTIKPLMVRKWKGNASPEKYLQYVVQHNLLRRQQPMTKAQRAQLLVSLNAEFLAPEGRPVGKQGNDCPVKTTESLAKEADCSERTVKTARAVHEAATPKQEQAVIDGKLSPADILLKRAQKDAPTDEEEGMDRDPFGNKFPEHVRKCFDRLDILLDWKNGIDAMRRSIREFAETGDNLATFLRLQGLEADLKNAAAAVRFAVPFCLCPYCAGDKCKACEKTGWMPKQLYEQVVPREMQWKASKAG